MELLFKKTKNFWAIVFVIFLMVEISSAQNYSVEDSVSEKMFIENKFDEVIKYSKQNAEAFKLEKLKLRKALSYYYNQNYSKALIELDSLSKEFNNKLANEYYLLTLEKLSRFEDIQWLSYNKERKSKHLLTLTLYNGILIGNKNQVPQLTSRNKNYAHVTFPENISINSFIVDYKLNPKWRFFLGYSYNKLTSYNLVNYNSQKKEAEYPWIQNGLYGMVLYKPKQNFELGAFYNYFVSTGTITIGLPFGQPDNNNNTKINYSNQDINSSGFALGTHFKFQRPFFTFEFNPALFSLGSLKQFQSENTLSILPFGNHKLYLVGKLFIQKDSANFNSPFSISLGKKFNNKFWLRTGYFNGNNNNLIAFWGSGIFTSLDNTRSYFDIEASIFIKKFTFVPRVVLYNRSIDYANFAMPGAPGGISTFNYQRLQASITLKYTL
jgi:hypothetical protein